MLAIDSVVSVDTGTKSQYDFQKTSFGIRVSLNGHDYTDFVKGDKGYTAVERLMEFAAEAKQFRDDAYQLAAFRLHDDKFDYFLEKDLLSGDEEEAFERVAEQMEEMHRKDEG